MTKPAYKILTSHSLDRLAEFVILAMEDGYHPIGGAFQIFNERENGPHPVWGQAMVITEPA